MATRERSAPARPAADTDDVTLGNRVGVKGRRSRLSNGAASQSLLREWEKAATPGQYHINQAAMLDTIQYAIVEIGRNCFLTLSNLTEDDRHMSLQKGVHISGLGTFTFSQQRLDVGRKLILIQRPVFVMSEKFVQIHGLSYTKQHVSGDIPIVELNFTFLALESPYDRDTVEGCVKETLQIMYRYIASNRNVHFTFKDIGVLTIRNNKIKMKFYREFLNAMDGSGSLVKALSNRPGTADSIKSVRDVYTSRPATTNSVSFPRISPGDLNERKSVLLSIKEENNRENHEAPSKSEQNELNRESEQIEKMKDREKSREATEMPHVKQSCVKQSLTPAKTSAVCLTEDFQKTTEPKDLFERLSSPNCCLSCQPGIQQTNRQSLKLKTPPATACTDHCRAGQELCYLCMQRALKNFPIDVSENRRRREEEHEQILQQYQQIKDQQALFQEQCEMLANREINQKISTFNMGVAEAKKRKKNSKCRDSYKGYIFQNRLLTPPVFLKQQQYAQCLTEQIQEKKRREEKKRQDEEFMDRLEQVQLAEDLAVQRQYYQREKHEQIETYKKALDTQRKEKPRQLPASVPDSFEPIFGNSEPVGKLEEQKQAAYNLYKEQMQAAADRKRNAILNQLYEQKTELDMLERNRKGLINERKKRYEDLQRMRKALEEAWNDNITMKRLKNYDENQYSKARGLFLLDQCNKYRRCFQCKRRLSNYGQTNIWNSTFITTGTN
ncbi:coiled-coil domain-containing protein 81-like isoform X2 [Stegostoma tigrinum]|uniref:coiled-coil domain-containing protein 81-like isoform X2 n=1 Tax=Stegostoma tigrinum TaxID=3053191 RepID=UPI00202AE82C|nr:coiled-coil domain-containing protein 81-like isoform X2 [Stegostoma tigrinum]